MKVILTGSTGFIGREVLDQCIQNPNISAIVALSRSELPTTHAKLKVGILDNFLVYPDSVRDDIADAEACIWCLGKVPSTEIQEARKACLDFTEAALNAMASITVKDENGKFRFVYLSGAAAERDQEKTLWFRQEYRRMRGQVENLILERAKARGSSMEAVIMRPGLVINKEQSIVDTIKGLGPSVRVDVLARALSSAALKCGKTQVVENNEIKELGK